MYVRVGSRPKAVVVAALIPFLVTACLPSDLDGRPPSFAAFLRRNGMEFTRGVPPPGAPSSGEVAEIAVRDGPFPASAINPPVYGVLSCPVACSGAVLSTRGEEIGSWFVSYPGTEYGGGDIAWVLVDAAMGVRVVSTIDNP
jgi:hypothetical protein